MYTTYEKKGRFFQELLEVFFVVVAFFAAAFGFTAFFTYVGIHLHASSLFGGMLTGIIGYCILHIRTKN